MIVENKAGAGTSIGAAFVSREAPDGYTILMATNSTLVTNRYLYKELPYDPDGFAPIGMVASARWCCCQPQAALRQHQGSGRLRQAAEPGQADLRHLRPRHLVAPGRRAVQAARRHRHPARRRSGRDPGAARADQRRGPVLRHGRHRDAAGRGRQGQGLRHHQPRTAGDRTGAAHAGRTGLPGLRRDGLVQLRGAARRPSRCWNGCARRWRTRWRTMP